eukprot:TRINITY_DN7811_c0_g1_i12.p1 TRINITY_DN7811_c0_g1~~TRINITY_DN7811_c0_g1_i12.p1  ORF type:complete len:228 (-),score=37.55 TRINITY_DN7811_c0_g1_i12:159-842(-)
MSCVILKSSLKNNLYAPKQNSGRKRVATKQRDVKCEVSQNISRRNQIQQTVTIFTALTFQQQLQFARADDFQTMQSGLKYLDVREGTGNEPKAGDLVELHWAGFTSGYQGKRIDNTSIRDEPYEFVLGGSDTIQAFQQGIQGMKVGGIRRIEVPGSKPELSYPRERNQRFTSELMSSDLKLFKYRFGPQPVELGGQRALDFVLDNPTLKDFNRTLVFDIKLLAVRRK